MSTSKKLIGWLTFLSIIAWTVPASATLFVRVADADLAADAAIIAEVMVRDSAAVASEGRPRTHVRMDVVEWIAGQARAGDGPLTVSLPGGTTAEGLQLRYFGVPQLEPGHRALVLLKPAATPGTYRLLHLMQGLFHVAEVDGRKLVYRDFVGATEMSLPGRKALDPEAPRDFARFTTWLRERRAGTARPADYWVGEPAVIEQIAGRAEKFTLFEQDGFNMRWRQFDSNASVTWFSHNAGQPGLSSGGHTEFRTALQAWNNDPATPIRLAYGGQTAAAGGFANFDNINVILFDDLSGDIGDPFSCQSGGTLAIGGPWFGSQLHTYRNVQYITILGGDIVTASGLACWIGFNNRAPEVFGHELGHTLGLGHSCGDSASGGCNTFAKDDALMRATAHGDGRGSRLGSDDRAGIGFLYGAPLTPPTPPNNLQAVPVGTGIIDLIWSDTASNETSFSVERRRDNTFFQQIVSLPANATSYRDTTAPSGSTVVYRVRAANNAGTSAYSNQATVITDGAPPPSSLAVEILSATEARLTWVDNAVGETGFEILADGFGAFLPAGTAGADATEAMVSGLWPNSGYTFRVRSVGGPDGDSSYVEASGTTLGGSPEPCQQDQYTQCLNQGRFKVQVGWRDFDDLIGPGSRVEVPTTDSGLFWFFDDDNWEMLVKVLDGCGFNDHFWVFAAATTNVEFTLIVSDTETGAVSVHENGLGVSAPAITDTAALPVCTAGGSAAAPPVSIRRTDDPSIRVKAVAPRLGELLKADCVEDETTTCLRAERFQVRATWRDFDDRTGDASIVDLPVVADDSGLLWFFAPDNWEVLIKVLDACDFNDRYWVFSAATTNVEYTIEVTDTLTDEVKTYTNTLGVSASAVTDTDAFATCP